MGYWIARTREKVQDIITSDQAPLYRAKIIWKGFSLGNSQINEHIKDLNGRTVAIATEGKKQAPGCGNYLTGVKVEEDREWRGKIQQYVREQEKKH